MAVRGRQTPGVLTLDSLARLDRARQASGAASGRLLLPDDMTVPLGCDAVAVPARYGPLVLPRLPRLGCVYADRTDWWWIVPSDSDAALDWPAPARYTRGALVPDPHGVPELIHRADDSVPYTPPIPLYLALCWATGATPAWARPISA
ncbi:hypothetical protein ACFYZJ_05190 [Streptomyces sp. NPDC001848]|uniref:hypothetical protein n=1 Tax=Streptomyces sp. NPDC001848 TaxID=3364618 RepID=UPI003684561C